MSPLSRLYAPAAFALLCGPAAASAQNLPAPAPEVAGKTVLHPPARQSRINFPDGVSQLPGITYSSPPGYRPLTLDLYLPQATATPPVGGYPLVIYVHGGAWMVGMSQQMGAFVDFPGVLASLAARGYVVASINYRLSSEAKWPSQPVDVGTAIRWLRGHAADYRINPTRGMIWGVSAGGHLTGMAAVAPDAPGISVAAKDDPYVSVSTALQGAVIWYGVFDIRTIAAQAPLTPGSPDHNADDAAEWKMLGCTRATCPADKLIAASPVTYVTASSPPMLLIAGTDDRTVPYQQSVEMADALKKAGVQHQLILMPGLDHGLIGKTKEETQAGTLKAFAATFAFIDRTIGPKSAH